MDDPFVCSPRLALVDVDVRLDRGSLRGTTVFGLADTDDDEDRGGPISTSESESEPESDSSAFIFATQSFPEEEDDGLVSSVFAFFAGRASSANGSDAVEGGEGALFLPSLSSFLASFRAAIISLGVWRSEGGKGGGGTEGPGGGGGGARSLLGPVGAAGRAPRVGWKTLGWYLMIIERG